MPKKPTQYECGRVAGYSQGWNARHARRVQDDFSLWNWSDWSMYVGMTLIVICACALVIVGLTAYLSWATYHPPSTPKCIEINGTIQCNMVLE